MNDRRVPVFNSLILFCACLTILTVFQWEAAAQDGNHAALKPNSHLSAMELKIWNDPAFKKQFAESYLAEIEIEPRVTVEERDQMQKVLELISSDQMGEAAKLLEASRNDASSAVFDFTLANIYFQQDKLDQAVTVYQAAVQKYPKFRRAWKNLGVIYIRLGDFVKAAPALTKVIELGGGDAVTYGLLGYAYSSIENYISAESAYRMAILLDPPTMDWKMGLARSFFKQERYAEAAALCGQLLKGKPERADLWLLQANAYIGLNQPMKAAENYELVDRLGESTSDSLNMLGDIYINEELFDLAVDTYIRAMDLNRNGKPDRAIRSAKVLAARGAMEETKRLIERIESQYGDQIETDARKDLLKLRARLAVASGASGEEVKVLEQIVELDPLDGEALILLGQNSSRNGDVEKAIYYYERAANIEGYEADAKVRQAQLLVGQGKYDEALPLLRRAQQVNPRDNVQTYLEEVERVAKTRS
ncbi:MAG: tetratricopeptide repeat protein [bacterium]|nr:tetratricopeptide repeat protein [bacterium]